MNEYTLTVGLEIHAELATVTKMFCDSKNDPFNSAPNANVCPICMGHPGTLPVINKEAVRHVLRVGQAIGGIIADFTEFDRKNYFYPDIPKGYQISQYAYPLITGGEVAGVKITRVHLEEDTASSGHDEGDYSLVDFNRAGVPLMELVTEPVIHSAKEAGDFGRELQLLLRYLGASEANMEKGEMRVEANISISPKSQVESGKLGTKVEVKNLNSFRSVERAIAYEYDRHVALLEKGEAIVQETRGWDDSKGATFSQRKKEDSHDYRYFPDPDLPKLKISEIPEFSATRLAESLPELPSQRRLRYEKEYGIKGQDIEVYVTNPELARFFEEAVIKLEKKSQVVLLSNYLSTDLLGIVKKIFGEGEEGRVWDTKVTPASLASLVALIDTKTLSSRGAKDTLALLVAEGGDAKEIAETNGLIQKSDPVALESMVKEVLSENQIAVDEYKKGKVASLMFLVGQGMKKSKGSANPEMLKEIFIKNLS
ncbi:MAG: Asp-tRNA(Asn)/Glu-tRNA(Gln) amidotransferase subunit GatB [Candidatus Taylorbacteria bacterium CG10_big_fil_rev_8_21_14_0_10_41_48]|uniref:Aspartyl/glutamyl-tRNA(Asn/Gln) amidotransferase subunit B n=1 Tax=Candidatus Taylorbacteria bacterium CG10_big_fil_rev_8_21_14_0_10_41_48 TaxID=1975024 RepID=A0A2M8LBC7_9BACT|nr:MAG: Asp-tRNA(Asn)/Glu-tRNA(Gln) amidotransferase subunit GatB [Candidatus Taylorbacteria bacterium CG10_big_fil_rev_8_21_14_0_10_41_48]